MPVNQEYVAELSRDYWRKVYTGLDIPALQQKVLECGKKYPPLQVWQDMNAERRSKYKQEIIEWLLMNEL